MDRTLLSHSPWRLPKGNHWRAASAYENAAESYTSAGQDERAKEVWTDAAPAWIKAAAARTDKGDHWRAASTYQQAAEAYTFAEQHERARAEWTHAALAWIKAAEVLTSWWDHEGAREAYNNAAEAYRLADKYTEANNAWTNAGAESLKARKKAKWLAGGWLAGGWLAGGIATITIAIVWRLLKRYGSRVADNKFSAHSPPTEQKTPSQTTTSTPLHSTTSASTIIPLASCFGGVLLGDAAFAAAVRFRLLDADNQSAKHGLRVLCGITGGMTLGHLGFASAVGCSLGSTAMIEGVSRVFLDGSSPMLWALQRSGSSLSSTDI